VSGAGLRPASTGGEPDGSAGALHDFWAVYEANRSVLAQRIAAALATDPELGPYVQDWGEARAAELSIHSDQLARRAALEGEWEPYEALISEHGAAYARDGLPFRAWSRAVSALRAELLPLLVAAYEREPGRLAAVMHAKTDFLDRVMTVLGDEYIRAKEEVIHRQADAIRELSTPVLRIRDRLLLMPVVGVVDTQRARQFTEALLRSIRAERAKAVVIDITGVPSVDSRVAQHLIQTVSAARLMGTTAVVTGLSPDVAQSLVTLGLDLSSLRAVGDLEGGIETAERVLAETTQRGA